MLFEIHWSTFVKTLICMIATLAASAANASLTITSVVGGAPTGVNYVNFDNVPIGASGGASGGLAISFSGGAGTVQGTATGSYAAPFLSNSNGLPFGDSTVSGPDTTRYLATEGPSGVINLVLPGQQLYFGLLWGSVDAGNTLNFFNSAGVSVGSISGLNVTTTANGDQGAAGTYYVNITSNLPFSRVVASGSYFEFDNVAYNPSIPVPESSSVVLLLAGLAFLSIHARRSKISTAA